MDILETDNVGIYDIKVISSDNSMVLIYWLNENGFVFDQNDKDAFESYIKKDWCFVTAKINPKLNEKEDYEIAYEGLAAPLIMRFESEKPIYPMALTGTGGFNTEVLIYLATDQKMICDEQMTLRYAKENDFSKRYNYYFKNTDRSSMDPKNFFTEEDFNLSYLCKFKATLTPEQMQEDIVFEQAPDNEPYREHIVEW